MLKNLKKDLSAAAAPMQQAGANAKKDITARHKFQPSEGDSTGKPSVKAMGDELAPNSPPTRPDKPTGKQMPGIQHKKSSSSSSSKTSTKSSSSPGSSSQKLSTQSSTTEVSSKSSTKSSSSSSKSPVVPLGAKIALQKPDPELTVNIQASVTLHVTGFSASDLSVSLYQIPDSTHAQSLIKFNLKNNGKDEMTIDFVPEQVGKIRIEGRLKGYMLEGSPIELPVTAESESSESSTTSSSSSASASVGSVGLEIPSVALKKKRRKSKDRDDLVVDLIILDQPKPTGKSANETKSSDESSKSSVKGSSGGGGKSSHGGGGKSSHGGGGGSKANSSSESSKSDPLRQGSPRSTIVDNTDDAIGDTIILDVAGPTSIDTGENTGEHNSAGLVFPGEPSGGPKIEEDDGCCGSGCCGGSGSGCCGSGSGCSCPSCSCPSCSCPSCSCGGCGDCGSCGGGGDDC